MRTTNTTPLLNALRAAGFESLALEVASMQDFAKIIADLRAEVSALREYATASADADMLESIIDAVTQPQAIAA